MTRHAQCQCGALTVDVEGDKEAVVLCSCAACQRKSGSAFALGAYFRHDQLTIKGEAREYVRVADSGQPFHQFFCPTCATTLYWYSAHDPARYGVAVGAFAERDASTPDRSVYDEGKPNWLTLPENIPGFSRGRDSDRSR